MMLESNDLIYFHIIRPTKVSYVFKARPAQDFGDLFVSFLSGNFFPTYNSGLLSRTNGWAQTPKRRQVGQV